MNFALILFLLTLGTGLAALLERIVLAPRRRMAARRELAEFDRRQQGLPAQPDAPALTAREGARRALEEKTLRPPAWIEYSASFFPVLVVVFFLRSFLAEPFKIPSSSMRPTLEVGDFILVNKFSYGIRLPILEQKIIPLGSPARGDVVVFRYPVNTSQDFIKRVVGLPGDTVVYRDKKLTVNGKPLPRAADGTYGWLEGLRFESTERWLETADAGSRAHDYAVAVNPQAPTVFPQNVRSFPGRENCDYNERGFTCKVPPGQYFVMGDNRDFSDDSRYWGFVPDENLRGKAFFIWFNADDITSFAFKRVGSGIR